MNRVLGLRGRRLVLASGSPRRADLLRAAGARFTVEAPDVDETLRAGADPAVEVVRLAAVKADAIAPFHPDAVVLAADTLVVLGDEPLGKPADADQARAMLARLSGRTHHVLTGVAARWHGRGAEAAERTAVTFAPLSEAEIETLLTDAPDKAGAYGIQGAAGPFVERVDGDFFNVVGLPLRRVMRLLEELQ